MTSSKKKWIGAAAAVALVVVGVVVFASRDSGSASDKDLIITAAVKRQTLRDEVTLSGTLGRVEQRQINAPTEGRISRVYLDDGADIAADQAILSVDGRDSVAEPGEFPFYRSLDVGAQGPDVRQLELILAAAGFNPGAVDDLYTEQTRFALAQWQAARNYPGASERSAKTVTVSLQPNGTGYTVGPRNTAAVTIGPDLGTPSGPVGRSRPRQSGGGMPRLSIRALSNKTPEGSPAQFVVEVDRDITQSIDFSVQISGTASGADVVAPAGKITIAAGARQVPLSIPTIADGATEGDEDFTVTIVDGDTYDLGDAPSATTTITSGEDLPEITMTQGSTVVEGGKVTLAISGGGKGGDVQVALNVTGTATAALDYLPITPVVTLDGGSSATFDVTTLTDSVIEPDETIIVSVAQSPNYKVGKISSAVVTIQGATGDAAKPTLTLSPLSTSVTEGSPINFSLECEQLGRGRRRAAAAVQRPRVRRHRLPATRGATRASRRAVVDAAVGADCAGRRRGARRGRFGRARAKCSLHHRQSVGRHGHDRQ